MTMAASLVVYHRNRVRGIYAAKIGRTTVGMELHDVIWPLAIILLVTILCGLYLWEITKSHGRRRKLDLAGIEPFANPGTGVGVSTDQRLDSACYDTFYARVYDILVQPGVRASMETKVSVEWMEKSGRTRDSLRIADIGCGTGTQVALFHDLGVKSVVGYDTSKDMIAEAKRRFPEREFVVGDATVATMAAASQFDIVTLLYFTVYLVPERTQMLKNIFLWLAPGGIFVVHIVNKHKFDPILEAASPFVGFSIQKYADERVTKSSVTFDEFEYSGDFQLHGSRAMYEEIFKFKDGRTRRHEQRVWMPNIDAIVAEIAAVGFKFAEHVDLTAIGYEYNYLFVFQK
jgi:SAM-dependent methyltransferase